MNLKESLETINDSRIDRCKKHSLVDILMIVFFGVLCGYKSIESIHLYAELSINVLKKYLLLANGIPSADTILREITLMLQKEGFRVAMDDFGSGESSLNMLSTIPVNILKFDRSFLFANDAKTGKLDETSETFIETLVDLGKNLKKETIFEGVETEEQRNFLRKINCDQVQGFFYSKPLREEEYMEYVFQTPTALLSEDEQKQAAERTKPWGTIHAVLCAKEAIHEPFAVINADDYYGRSAFETLGKYLSSINNDCTEHAMVGYILGNTMSRNGSVSRGVAQTEGGYLNSIVENTKIYYTGEHFSGNEIESDLNGQIVKMTGKETVSMNLFGFSPKAFEGFEEYWANFKKTSLALPKAEALLPVAASDIIKNGEGKIKVFTSDESWFGMTYPEDKQVVKDEIAKKIASGYYPEKLWEK